MENKLAPAGYKLADVAAVKCLVCDEPIGDEPYNEITGLARFGTMMFEHQRCHEAGNAIVQLSPPVKKPAQVKMLLYATPDKNKGAKGFTA